MKGLITKAIAASAFALVLFFARDGHAQALRPNILLIFDTSSSMNKISETSGVPAADGSPLCAGAGQALRTYNLKKAIREAITEAGTDEVNFGLMRFPQKEDPALSPVCPTGRYFVDASTAVTNGANQIFGCRISAHNGETAFDTWFTANDAFKQSIVVEVTKPTVNGAPVASDFDPPSGNIPEVFKWLDQQETVAGGKITNPEIRAGGDTNQALTPLGRSLFYSRLYFDNVVKRKVAGKTVDQRAACRKNVVVLITDGAETCDGSQSAFSPFLQSTLLFASGVELYVLTDTSTGVANDTISFNGSGAKRPTAIRVNLGDAAAVKRELLSIIAESVPKGEVCNGVDDDCDDLVDEAPLPQVGSQCGCGGKKPEELTKGICQPGAFVCKGTQGPVCEGCVPPQAEVCNGIDDNCDGQIDEGFELGKGCSNMLQGACYRTGTTKCGPDGNSVICDAPAVAPAAEICNALDDDCNGMVDDGALPGVGAECGVEVGECKSGKFVCTKGQLVCAQIIVGNPEMCDGNDNDCNGQTDEGLGGKECACNNVPLETLKTGECRPGKEVCHADVSAILCDGCVPPRDEICDGKDNDCDGMTDEGMNVCLTGRECVKKNAATDGVAAKCEPVCSSSEFPCNIGFECTVGNRSSDDTKVDVCLSTKCRTITCDVGLRCNPGSGACENPCEGVKCTAPKQCLEGTCKDCRESPSLCKTNELCLDGVCKSDPCVGVSCSKKEYCDNGKCVSDCAGTCSDSEQCIEGRCEVNPRAGIPCPAGQVCDPTSRDCKVDQCLLTPCPGQICVPLTGRCIDDPCRTVKCAEDSCASCTVTSTGQAQCRAKLDCVDKTAVRTIKAAGGGCSCNTGSAKPGGLSWLALANVMAVVGALIRKRRRKQR